MTPAAARARLAAGAAGLVLLSTWVGSLMIFAGPRWLNWGAGLGGLALFAGYAWLDRERVRRLVLSPQMRHGSNAMLFSVAVVAVIALLNVIASNHSFRADLTANKFFSLSDQTEKILEGLEQDIKVTFFLQAGNPESNQIEDLLEQYAHASKRIKLEKNDPDQKPARAQLYKITNYNTVVFESGSQRKDVLPGELFDYQFTGGRQPRREFKGEAAITAAILSVNSEKQTTIYFLEGHGELGLEDQSQTGLSALKAGLERDNFVVKSLNLLKEGAIPDDADLLVIAGPQNPIPAQERELIAAYLDGEGRAIILFSAGERAGLGKLLGDWGITVLDGLVIDPRSYFPFGSAFDLIPQYRLHPITEDLSKQRIAAMLPGSVAFETKSPGTGQITTLLDTTPESWLETSYRNARAAPKFDSGKDRKGPLDVAVAVTRNPASPAQDPGAPPPPEKPDPKLVVFGSAHLVAGQVLQTFASNFDLFANAVSWLAGSEETISIRPKSPSRRTVALDNVRVRLMLWVTVILTPLGILGVGAARWWRRRSL